MVPLNYRLERKIMSDKVYNRRAILVAVVTVFSFFLSYRIAQLIPATNGTGACLAFYVYIGIPIVTAWALIVALGLHKR